MQIPSLHWDFRFSLRFLHTFLLGARVSCHHLNICGYTTVCLNFPIAHEAVLICLLWLALNRRHVPTIPSIAWWNIRTYFCSFWGTLTSIKEEIAIAHSFMSTDVFLHADWSLSFLIGYYNHAWVSDANAKQLSKSFNQDHKQVKSQKELNYSAKHRTLSVL